MFGSFAIYSTNFLSFISGLQVLSLFYSFSIIIRGVVPAILPREYLFKNLPFIHLSFLLTTLTLSILTNNLGVYLIGISISAILGMYTSSFVYALEVSLSKELNDPTRFFSTISGVEAIAFFIAPILSSLVLNKLLFLSILLSLACVGFSFLVYFRFLSKIHLKFYSGQIKELRLLLPIALIAGISWLLQYLWMGSIYIIGEKLRIPITIVLSSVEGETALYILLQSLAGVKGFKRIAKLKLGYLLIFTYGVLVFLFESFTLFRVNTMIFVIVVLSFAIASFLIEPLIDTLTSLTKNASENSTIIVVSRTIGGGIGYIISLLLTM